VAAEFRRAEKRRPTMEAGAAAGVDADGPIEQQARAGRGAGVEKKLAHRTAAIAGGEKRGRGRGVERAGGAEGRRKDSRRGTGARVSSMAEAAEEFSKKRRKPVSAWSAPMRAAMVGVDGLGAAPGGAAQGRTVASQKVSNSVRLRRERVQP